MPFTTGRTADTVNPGDGSCRACVPVNGRSQMRSHTVIGSTTSAMLSVREIEPDPPASRVLLVWTVTFTTRAPYENSAGRCGRVTAHIARGECRSDVELRDRTRRLLLQRQRATAHAAAFRGNRWRCHCLFECIHGNRRELRRQLRPVCADRSGRCRGCRPEGHRGRTGQCRGHGLARRRIAENPVIARTFDADVTGGERTCGTATAGERSSTGGNREFDGRGREGGNPVAVAVERLHIRPHRDGEERKPARLSPL